MKSQTKVESFIEASTNVLIGYWVAIGSQLLIFPLFGIHIPLASNLMIGVWFTVVSFIRSYALRRWFNSSYHSFVHRVLTMWGTVGRENELQRASVDSLKGASAGMTAWMDAGSRDKSQTSADYNGVIRSRLEMQWQKTEEPKEQVKVQQASEAAESAESLLFESSKAGAQEAVADASIPWHECPNCGAFARERLLSCAFCSYGRTP